MKTNRLKTDYFDPGESRSKREKGKRKRRKHARGTNLLDLPPCTETVVTCSRPPKSTIARYPPFPLVSYVKTVFAPSSEPRLFTLLALDERRPRVETRPTVSANIFAG